MGSPPAASVREGALRSAPRAQTSGPRSARAWLRLGRRKAFGATRAVRKSPRTGSRGSFRSAHPPTVPTIRLRPPSEPFALRRARHDASAIGALFAPLKRDCHFLAARACTSASGSLLRLNGFSRRRVAGLHPPRLSYVLARSAQACRRQPPSRPHHCARENPKSKPAARPPRSGERASGGQWHRSNASRRAHAALRSRPDAQRNSASTSRARAAPLLHAVLAHEGLSLGRADFGPARAG
jgi:hypothetical protein